MRTNATVLVALLAVLGLAGCGFTYARQPAPLPPEEMPKASEAPYLKKVGVVREADPAALPTAVESTLLVQDKYARTLEDLSREQQRNRELEDSNRKLESSAAKVQADLAKAQKELADANDLLLQMRQEIEKWKGDVLGFRDELRRANLAQLDALGKVLTLLGGDATAGQVSMADKPAAAETKAAPPADTKAAAAPQPKAPAPARAAAAAQTVKPLTEGKGSPRAAGK